MGDEKEAIIRTGDDHAHSAASFASLPLLVVSVPFGTIGCQPGQNGGTIESDSMATPDNWDVSCPRPFAYTGNTELKKGGKIASSVKLTNWMREWEHMSSFLPPTFLQRQREGVRGS